MTAKLLLLLLLAAGASADYWTDRGYTYEVYDFVVPTNNPQSVYQQPQYYYPQYYPVQNYYPQQQQHQHHHQQNHQQYYPQVQVTQRPNYDQVTQQTTPSVSVSEAEWVCRNTKTNDMMIIASEDGPVPNRVNGQQQWHQVYPQQQGNNQPQQPVYPQPQQPVYPTQTQAPPVTNAPTTTIEDTNRPIWGDIGNDNRYPQTQAPVTNKPTPTTEDTNRPIWGGNNNQPSFPDVKPNFPTSTTQKPLEPLWPDSGSNNKPGFTVIEPTPKPKPHKTTKAPIDDDDDGPLEIVMG